MSEIFDDIHEVSDGDVVVTGIPFDDNSSYLPGCADAPSKIREAFFSDSSNLFSENGTDLNTTPGWHVLPDYRLQGSDNAFPQLEAANADLVGRNFRVIALGGDHSITLPLVRGYAAQYPRLSILHFDAHPDLYDELAGNRFSHACPFARIMEEQLATRLVQVGIRTMTVHQREQAQRFGVEVIDMSRIGEAKHLTFAGPVYLSIDLDCLDPAFAPGVSHYEPGGMTTRELLEILHNLKADIVGADIVEYNPTRDIHGVTAMVAAKLLKELIAVMVKGGND